ncbi:protein lifeguard 1 [Drosophila sulfurigaster albostrigata]|uniref:protein lifeguard 1 n=1 Tax=Drosophila sulfurigaster albostrigata TaxID=89887 RepID=UPI002D219907|nr:protein lifeguard 1 [Drosophila sulfurigaster albostrigata]
MAMTKINPDYHLPIDNQIRRGFIRKVYFILMCQLFVTLGAVVIFFFFPEVKDFVERNIWILRLDGIIMVVTMVACWFEIVRRQTPMNFTCLGSFTFARSFFLGVATSYYADNKVLLAIGTTVAICLSLTLFAMQTKWDLTVLGKIVIYAKPIFDLFSIFFGGKLPSLTYSSLCAFFASFNLIYDTQLMMGGNVCKYIISQEEYIFAISNLYFDISNIFLNVLNILGITEE